MAPRKGDSDSVVPRSSAAELAAFKQAAQALAQRQGATGAGRLVFALDATMSRQPTWDLACELQAEMFEVADEMDGLEIQLLYFRGLGECRASKWTGRSGELARLMQKIDCRGGRTQIEKVLKHARAEAGRGRVNALIYIGDAMEENVDQLCVLAGELGLRKLPCFMFHEGGDPAAEAAFREIARLSGGAYARFNAAAAAELKALLGAVARYASGGRVALEHQGGEAARLLLRQLPPDRGDKRGNA
ncbi:VWA domain-containing protein [Pseudohoeflea sp. DP4N28-3]|uniref:VWA domain-containing protein n=1 Tax=Pseudohoeflea coraliihabitans TaxID=2860393 RepID=A0ABS6WRF8_9HYPH|nr:VWA domain-containing protein [Pseudohoeflea sp. DP4N28-3]